jgi:predicted O-methyltransferase YrrM
VIHSVAARSAQVQAVREHVFGSRTVAGRSDGRARDVFPVAIGEVEGLALREWVRREGALRTLETGLGFGVSTLFICEGLLANGDGGRHLAVDPYQLVDAYDGVGLQVLEEAGVRDLVEFYAEESQIVLPRLLGEGRRFDLAFIDGNHRFEGVLLDLIYSARLLVEHGIVFADDAQLPGVRRAISFCVANLGWVAEDEGAERDHHEWTILRVGPSDVFHRGFRQFAEF